MPWAVLSRPPRTDAVLHLSPVRRSFVRTLFQGQHAYVTRCLSCGGANPPPRSPFLDLMAPVRGFASVEDGLRSCFQPDFLCGDNKYACERCGGPRDAVRYQQVHQWPPVLTVTLERFTFDLRTLERKKASDAVVVSRQRLCGGDLGGEEDGELTLRGTAGARTSHVVRVAEP